MMDNEHLLFSSYGTLVMVVRQLLFTVYNGGRVDCEW